MLEVLGRLENANGVAEISHAFSPTEELVSCILSQHTSDANSFPAFDKLRDHYQNLAHASAMTEQAWQALVDRGEVELADVVRSAGLANQKAKSIIRCLEEIRARTGGYDLEFLARMAPLEARKWLMNLHGVGPKTASIVLMFAFGMDVIPVDTHVYRVSWRLGLIGQIGEGKAHDALAEIVPKGLGFRFHTDLIVHGRKTCKAQGPLCPECAVSGLCKWFKSQGRRPRKGGNRGE